MKILITGGAGFIGSALIRYLIKNTNATIINIDKLTYAANLDSLKEIEKNERYIFKKEDICNRTALDLIFKSYKPDAVMHLAAESHVDRSIDSSIEFLQTNILGTFTLLEASRNYYNNFQKNNFRFHHISTDEVYGSLGNDGFFSEHTSYAPNSPYSATKASSDHLVRAWNHTYGLPTLITNCSNNYGPYHFPEKLIPLIILNAISGKDLPIYGNGENIRDWLFVDDHVEALYTVLLKGKIGETYNIGGNCEKTNVEVVTTICEILDNIKPSKNFKSYKDQIKFVQDRPGHDKRYAINAEKIKKELGWVPKENFESGILKTIQWYLENEWWYKEIKNRYSQERLGLNLKAA